MGRQLAAAAVVVRNNSNLNTLTGIVGYHNSVGVEADQLGGIILRIAEGHHVGDETAGEDDGIDNGVGPTEGRVIDHESELRPWDEGGAASISEFDVGNEPGFGDEAAAGEENGVSGIDVSSGVDRDGFGVPDLGEQGAVGFDSVGAFEGVLVVFIDLQFHRASGGIQQYDVVDEHFVVIGARR